MQSSMCSLHPGDLRRQEEIEQDIAAHVVALTAEMSTCHNCGTQGHYARKYPQDKADNTKQHGTHN